MTKKDIVCTIHQSFDIDRNLAQLAVQQVLDVVLETLVREGRVELRNFGVFEVQQRAARKARNPQTGNEVDVPEKYVVSFKPGRVMQQRVGNEGGRDGSRVRATIGGNK